MASPPYVLLHRHRGETWWTRFHQNHATLQHSRAPLKAFLGTVASSWTHVRCVGTHENSDLLHYLLRRQQEYGLPGVVQVCSPRLLEEEKLQNMAQLVAVVKSIPEHYWNTWRQDELATFAIMSLLRKLKEPYESQEMLRQLSSHPLWPLLSFFTGMSLQGISGLIAGIVHPRWYVGVEPGVSVDNWTKQLGILPSNVAAIFKSTATVGSRYQNYGADIVAGWLGDDFPGPMAQLTETAIKDPKDYFLWTCRNYFAAQRKLTFKPKCAASRDMWVAAIHYTTSHFVEMACSYWLHAVTVSGDGLFVPQYFFSNKGVADAVQRHLESSRVTPPG